MPSEAALLHLPSAPGANWDGDGETRSESAEEFFAGETDGGQAQPAEAPDPVVLARVVPTDTVVSRPGEQHPTGPIRMEIPAALVARARTLGPTLPDGVLSDEGQPIDRRVLRAALHLGLASLAAIADIGDGD